jgi:hypothetical protein
LGEKNTIWLKENKNSNLDNLNKMSTESAPQPAIPVVTVPESAPVQLQDIVSIEASQRAVVDSSSVEKPLEEPLNQAEFASMISGEDVTVREPAPTAPPTAVVTPVAEKPLEKPLHYDLTLPQPVVYTPLRRSKRVKRSSQKGKK